MKPKCVMRQEKKKAREHINNTDNHNSRKKLDTRRKRRENVDPKRSHYNRIYVTPSAGSLWAEVDYRCDQIRNYAKAMRKKGMVKKNSVKCVEFYISASAEYFAPMEGKETIAGLWDKRKTDNWAKTTAQYLQDEWGDDILRLDLHLDEKTPHFHAEIWGGHGARNRLAANETFLTPKNLENYHDRYAEAVKDLGIQRAKRGSGAKHVPEAEYRRLQRLGEAKVKVTPKLTTKDILTKNRVIGKADTISIHIASPKEARRLAAIATSLAGQLEVQTARADQLANANSKKSYELAKLRPIAASIRDLDKAQIVEDWRKATGKELPSGAEKARNAIDLVKLLENCDYKKAVLLLAQNYSEKEAVASAINNKFDEIKDTLPLMIATAPTLANWHQEAQKRAIERRVNSLPEWKKMVFSLDILPLEKVEKIPPPSPLDQLIIEKANPSQIWAYCLAKMDKLAQKLDISNLFKLSTAELEIVAKTVLKIEGVSDDVATKLLKRSEQDNTKRLTANGDASTTATLMASLAHIKKVEGRAMTAHTPA